MTADFPVDLVVLWVNGNDSSFVRERNAWAARLGVPVEPARFVQTDELRYVLRSVEKFLPWISRVVLVTNGQVPPWLNSHHPRLKILPHHAFMPPECLPTFNSCAISIGVSRWPGLAEHYLLANDDTFVWSSLPKEYFFPKKGRVRNYYMFYPRKNYADSSYGRQLLHIVQELSRVFPNKRFPLEPFHNIQGYLKSSTSLSWQLFNALLTCTLHSRFRKEDNLNCYFFAGVAAACGQAEWHATRQSRFLKSDAGVWELWQNYAQEIKKYAPRLVCLNDSKQCRDEDRRELQRYLQRVFAQASSFEI